MAIFPLLESNFLIFMGIFLIIEAIFSIVYYFKGSALPHVFRVIRAFFGVYLVWGGAKYTLPRIMGFVWAQVAFFFIIVALCILAGYELAIVLERGK